MAEAAIPSSMPGSGTPASASMPPDRHHQRERHRQHPDRRGAELRAPEADGDHGEDVVESRDRVTEPDEEAGGLARCDVRGGRPRAQDRGHDDRGESAAVRAHHETRRRTARRCIVQKAPSVPTV